MSTSHLVQTLSGFSALVREAKLAVLDRSVIVWLFVVLSLASIAVGCGLIEMQQQRTEIQRLLDADQQDRNAILSKYDEWGYTAYYSFHLTYDPPSNFSFAAMGQRDVQPWKHRIRMLALEGQIYERDAGNPVIALIGRFDFAFFSAFILPLVLIMLLYDLRTSERTAGRHDLLEATSTGGIPLWLARTLVRVSAVFFCVITPLIIAGIIAGVDAKTLLQAILFIFLYVVVWSFICFTFSAWRKTNSLILMSLIGVWLTLAVILPAGFKQIIDRSVDVPTGAEILMLQRETVNDAWDLPREATLKPFFERHPQWADYTPVESAFEWQWYYAFQQVGDQRAENLSKAYRDGRALRDRIAAWASLLTPPSMLERALQSLANTDVKASIAYEESVRAYHTNLRAFYYPKFFQNLPFDKTELKNLPDFKPTH